MGYPGKPTEESGAELVPDLATGQPEISADGLTYTFTLKSGVFYAPTFEDVQVTAGDFIRALEREADPNASVGGYSFYYSIIEGFDAFGARKADAITGLEAPNDSTLVVTLTQHPASCRSCSRSRRPIRSLWTSQGSGSAPRRAQSRLRPVPRRDGSVHVRRERGPRLLGHCRRAGTGGWIPSREVDPARPEPLPRSRDRRPAAGVPGCHQRHDRRGQPGLLQQGRGWRGRRRGGRRRPTRSPARIRDGPEPRTLPPRQPERRAPIPGVQSGGAAVRRRVHPQGRQPRQ